MEINVIKETEIGNCEEHINVEEYLFKSLAEKQF